MRRYELKSNLSEKQVEMDVANFFGWISPIGQVPFRLLDIDEGLFGADAQYSEVYPLFLQFKKSNGLKSINEIKASRRKNRSKLEDIRIFRSKTELDDNPTLYFQLRKKAKHADDFQHNILLNYANTGFSSAFYVAPLTLDKDEYSLNLYSSVDRFLPTPFEYRDIQIYQKKWVSYLGFVPFLRGHVSIVPHERVDTYKHYYSYSQNGTDISWHSPLLLEKMPMRLSDKLSNILSNELFGNKQGLSIETLADKLSTMPILEGYDLSKYKSEEIIYLHGQLLLEKYEIRQFLLIINRNKSNL